MSRLQLALDGGTPTLASGYQASWPSDRQPAHRAAADMLQAVQHAPGTEPFGQPMLRKLERRWADAVGRRHAIACRSGRVALVLALAGLEMEPGDEVIIPGDAVWLARAVAAAGYTPVATDLHPLHLHIDPQAVVAAIGPRTRAVVAVDLHGTTADYRQLVEICGRRGLSLIEDGSQSVGALFDQRPVGSHGEASICSFVGRDLRSSLGTAGLYATDDDDLAAAARRRLLVNNEHTDPMGPTDPLGPDDGMAGWTCQLSELDAAVCENHLRASWSRLGTRVRNGTHLRRRLSSLPGIWVPEPVRGANHVYTSLPLTVLPDELGLAESMAAALRDVVVDCLTAEGLWVDRWSPQPLGGATPGGARPAPVAGPVPWAIYGRAAGELPVAAALAATGLVLGSDRCPFDDPHTTDTMDRIADCFAKIFVDNADRLRDLTEERDATN